MMKKVHLSEQKSVDGLLEEGGATVKLDEETIYAPVSSKPLFGELYEEYDDFDRWMDSDDESNHENNEETEKCIKSSKRKLTGKKQSKKSLDLLGDTKFTSFLGQAPGYTDEENPAAVRNTRYRNLKRGEKKLILKTPREISIMGVEAVIKRVAARGGMYKALSSINGVWPTSGAKSIVHSCPVVDGSVCSIFPVPHPN